MRRGFDSLVAENWYLEPKASMIASKVIKHLIILFPT